MRLRPNRPDQDSFALQTTRGRVDEALKFLGRWFSNRLVSPVFTPLMIAVAQSYLPDLPKEVRRRWLFIVDEAGFLKRVRGG